MSAHPDPWRNYLRAIPPDLPDDERLPVPVGVLRALVAGETASDAAPAAEPVPPAEPSWRERLWTAPGETRIGKAEVCEALGRPESWLYRHTSKRSTTGENAYPRIPHRRLEGELVFLVGELREWVREHEEVVQAGRMESTPTGRGPGARMPAARTRR